MTSAKSTSPNEIGRQPPALSPYDLYMLALSVLALVVLAVDTLLQLDTASREVLVSADTLFCVLFFADFLRSLRLAPNRRRYLLTVGWLDLLSSIPAAGILRLGRISRVTRLVRLFRAVRSVRTIGTMISRHRQQSALVAAVLFTVVLVVLASLAILQFETDAGANIKTGGDALWWAATTITTVGYGDHFPISAEGRIVAVLLMAGGVALFGTLSGLLASWFLRAGDTQQVADDRMADLTKEISELKLMIQSRIPSQP